MDRDVLIKRIKQLRDSASDDDDREFDRLFSERRAQQLKEIPSPQCCEGMRKYPTVYMYLPWDDTQNNNDGAYIEEPVWKPNPIDNVKDGWDAPNPSFCPYCGKSLPEFVRIPKKNWPKPLVNAGYSHCRTCGERVGRYGYCTCVPYEATWTLKDV